MAIVILPDRLRLPALTSVPATLTQGDLLNVDDILYLVDSAGEAIKIPKSPIGSADIADGAITTAKIANGAVTSAKIATGAVGTDQIADGAVTNAKISSVNLSKVVVDTDLNMGGRNITNVNTLNVTNQVNVGDLVFKNGWRKEVQVAINSRGVIK